MIGGLEPANILLDAAGKVRIADFGLAKSQQVASDSSVGRIVGTPASMSPEQCRGFSSTPQSDVYAAAVVLFELVTGARPFPGPTVLDFLTRHTTHTAPRARQLDPDLPRELDDLIESGLAKDPAQRPASAAAYRKALLDIQRTLTPASSGGGAAAYAGLPPRRWLTAGVVLCAALAGTAAIAVRREPATPAPSLSASQSPSPAAPPSPS